MSGSRASWLDAEGGVAIDDYARKLESFMQAMEDGVVSGAEVTAQEAVVAEIMREVEPMLDDAAHAKVTGLLCELSAFVIMQLLHELQVARVKAVWRG